MTTMDRTNVINKVFRKLEGDARTNLDLALETSDLNWEAVKVPYTHPMIAEIDQTKTGFDPTILETNQWTVYRKDNYRIIGNVGAEYDVHQPKEVFKILVQLAGETGFEFDTFGAIEGGRKGIFGSLKLPTAEIILGDTVDYKLVVKTDFNGRSATEFSLFQDRRVCSNGMRREVKIKGSGSKFYHSKNGHSQLTNAPQLLQMVSKTQADLEEKMRFLASVQVDQNFINAFLDEQVGKAFKEDGKAITRTTNTREEIVANMFADDIVSIRNTAYGLFQGYTETIDHGRSFASNERKNPGSKAISAAFGTYSNDKNDAFDLLVNMANKQAKGLALEV